MVVRACCVHILTRHFLAFVLRFRGFAWFWRDFWPFSVVSTAVMTATVLQTFFLLILAYYLKIHFKNEIKVVGLKLGFYQIISIFELQDYKSLRWKLYMLYIFLLKRNTSMIRVIKKIFHGVLEDKPRASQFNICTVSLK